MSKLNWSKATATYGAVQGLSNRAELETNSADAAFYKKFARQPLLGEPVFIYDKNKTSRAVHIKTFHGTVCRLENQGKHVIKRLKTVSKDFPEGRTICQLCDKKYFDV